LEIVLIGACEADIPPAARTRILVHGRYEETEAPALLARYRPHLIWFPQCWPETYSYTLSAALASGLPIAAPGIGAVPARLAGRPLTWVIPPTLDVGVWLALLDTAAAALRASGKVARARRPAVRAPPIPPTRTQPARRAASGLIDLRRAGTTA